MRFWLVTLLLLMIDGGRAWAADDPLPAREQATAARTVLDAWRAGNAQPTERVLHIICWTPNDRAFPADHRARLTRMLKHIQAFYSNEMERNGLGPVTFNLKFDAAGDVAIHEIRGQRATAAYGKESGSEIKKECLPTLVAAGIDASRETVAIFCNLATWDAEKLRFTHESPYYAGGNYRSGTAWQLDSPELDVTNLNRSEPKIRDGQYGNISLGKHNSIFIGGMAHELGHAFGLPHCTERPDEAVNGTSLMGSGNRSYGDELRGEGRGSFLTFADALRVASHPVFCRVQEKSQQQTKLEVRDLDIRADGKAIEVRGVMQGEPPLYALVAYFDPEGNDDYNATTATAAFVDGGRFVLRSETLDRGKRGRLRLVALHANGATSASAGRETLQYGYEIAADGTPDLSALEIRRELAAVLKALNANQKDAARRQARAVKSPAAAKVAAALVNFDEPKQTPAEYRGKPVPQSLTNFKPTSAKVGYYRPTYNRLPEESILVESGGAVYATGIYSHAPAKHEYALGGKWQRLTGKAGLADGHTGSVQFVIHGDGRELWKSPVVKADKTLAFDVDVSGVQNLVLTTETTDDGPGSDWGLWLEPTLHPAEVQ